MVASTSVPLNKKSQEKFIQYYRNMQLVGNLSRTDLRSRWEEIDRNYMREQRKNTATLRARAAIKAGDPSRFEDIVIPIVAPQVEAAVTQQAKIFLTKQGLFDVVAGPEFMQEAMQLETILENNSIRGGWVRELIMFFRDGFKYNFAPLEVSWDQEVTYSIDTELTENLTQGTPKEVIWSGNKIRRLDIYNTFVDPRVPPSQVYKKAEWAGFTEFMSRLELKSYIARLPDKISHNVIPAFESGTGMLATGGTTAHGSESYFEPNINPLVSTENYTASGTNWLQWAGIESRGGNRKQIDYRDAYEVTTLYAKVLPEEFELKVKGSQTPQIYKLIIINHKVIIYAELQTNAHGYIPILIGQPIEDGLQYQTKSLATNGTPFQNLASAFMASIVASKRRSISDRTLFDPSRITSANINSPNPSAKIPVKPGAYGTQISDAVYAFPYREDQMGNDLAQISTIKALANELVGQNPVNQGQHIKGNKTNSQFDTVMDNANGSDQLAAILLEDQVFIPMKHILKIDILQFQGGVTLYNRDAEQAVEINPIALRKSVMEFKVSDGLVAAEELIDGEAFAVALQGMGSIPGVADGFNIAPLFSYIVKTQGADLTPFEKSAEQVAFEQAFNQWSSLIALAIEKGLDPKEAERSLPAAPLPEQFGYDPSANSPTSEEEIPEEPTGNITSIAGN